MNNHPPQERHPHRNVAKPGTAVAGATSRHTEPTRGETENLSRVLTKLLAYERLAKDGPRYPVLLWVPTRQREKHLLDLLHGTSTAMPVATATHCPDPGGTVWTLAGADGPRLALHQLPSDHGPRSALNPARFHEPHDDDPPPENL